MAAERRSKIVRWTVGVGILLVALAIALPYVAIHSSTCLDRPARRGAPGGCTELYFIEPFGWTVGSWFGIVGGAVTGGAFLFLLIRAGWVFQRFMEKRERE